MHRACACCGPLFSQAAEYQAGPGGVFLGPRAWWRGTQAGESVGSGEGQESCLSDPLRPTCGSGSEVLVGKFLPPAFFLPEWCPFCQLGARLQLLCPGVGWSGRRFLWKGAPDCFATPVYWPGALFHLAPEALCICSSFNPNPLNKMVGFPMGNKETEAEEK